ncbi:MAG: T9SS type A sorting domain-containing protein [Calditrichaeota bacterium]|nr:T9SS type A sorting domain-containing protein [Calditrichota bacterium]MCB9366263.1 T9SS type A sorting domain-containing protein [Calditrichota bacterium]MCB9391667.1 T9SS type A sorting domain-containing protein [Calditrichota bacterium]
MIALLALLIPLFALAQGTPQTDKPCGPVCAHSRMDVRTWLESLDAESLHTYDQLELVLHVSVQDGDLPMEAMANLHIVAREGLAEIPFNAEGLTVTDVTVNGQTVAFTHAADTLYAQHALAVAETADVAVTYSAAPNPDWYDTGFQTGFEHCYTFSEPFGARRWYPCWDQPSDKFDQVTMIVETPETWTLAANGRWLNSTFPNMGRVTHTYHHDKPIAPYLVMFAAGNFSNQVFEQDDVQYRYFAWPCGDSLAALYDWERTPEMVNTFSGLFGTYPFDEYGMVMTDIFGGWGAMEHQTFTTYGFNLVDSARSFEGIVAHELGHQWFGDHLSPVDFRNMWLNEGFATYCDALWSEHLGGEAALNEYMARSATYCINEERFNPPSYSVYDPPMERVFGTNVYYKGAWVMHMLRKQILGDSLFYAVLQDYVATYGGANVSTQDLIDKVNEHWNGDDFQWFWDQWVYGLGIPSLNVEVTPRSDLNRVDVHFLQPTETGLFEIPFIVEYGVFDYTERDTFWTGYSEEGFASINEYALIARLAPVQIALFENVSSHAGPGPALPSAFSVSPAYPNPFNPSVTIPFTLGKTADVTLELFDITGRRVATLLSGKLEAGEHSFHYDAPATLSAGVYLLRAQSGESSVTQKLLLLK